MKIIKFVFYNLLAFSLVACTVIFIFFQTFDTDQYLSQATTKASMELGRPVSIGHLGLGLSSRGISLDAGPVVIADDPGFTSQPFITVDRVRIKLDIGSLFLHRKIQVTDILIESPQIHLIRSLDGKINTQSIGQSIQITGVNKIPGNNNNHKSDRDLKVQGHKEDGLLSALNVRSIRVQDASISYIDQNLNFPVDIWLTDIDADIKDFSLFNPFQSTLDASFYSNTPNVHLSTILSLDLSKRSIQTNVLRLSADLSRLDIDRLKGISPGLPDNSIIENIGGNVQLNLTKMEIGDPAGLRTNGNISITNGIIKNFSIVKMAFSHIPVVFSGMDGIIGKLGGDDTKIEKAQAQFSLHDKTLVIETSSIKTNILELTAQGSIDLGGDVGMETVLHLNNDLSATLVNELDGLKYLMDDSKRISIGASLNGKIPHLKYKPNKDFKKKTKKVWQEEGGNILGVLLGGGKFK